MSKVFQSKDGTRGDFEKSLKNVLLVVIDYKSSLVPYAYHPFIFFLIPGLERIKIHKWQLKQSSASVYTDSLLFMLSNFNWFIDWLSTVKPD